MDGDFPKDRNLNHLLSSLTSSSSSSKGPSVYFKYVALTIWPWENMFFSIRHMNSPIHPSIHPLRKSTVWTWGNVTFQPCWRTEFWIWICVFRDAVVLVGSFHPEMENTSFSCNRALEEISLKAKNKKTVTLTMELIPWLMNLQLCLWHSRWSLLSRLSWNENLPRRQRCIAIKNKEWFPVV